MSCLHEVYMEVKCIHMHNTPSHHIPDATAQTRSGTATGFYACRASVTQRDIKQAAP